MKKGMHTLNISMQNEIKAKCIIAIGYCGFFS